MLAFRSALPAPETLKVTVSVDAAALVVTMSLTVTVESASFETTLIVAAFRRPLVPSEMVRSLLAVTLRVVAAAALTVTVPALVSVASESASAESVTVFAAAVVRT